MDNIKTISIYFCCIWCFASLLVSCTSKTTHHADIPQITFSFSGQLPKQSDYLRVADVIKLETNDSALIGYMSDVICRPSGFYVSDNKLSKQIIKFDKQGNFLFAINKPGRGPGEYLKLREICVDAEDRFLYLYDSSQKKIICYNSSDGKYIRHFNIDFIAYSFSVLPDNKHFLFYCSYTGNPKLKKEHTYPQFIVADSTGQIKKTWAYFDEKINSQNMITVGNVFTLTDTVLYFFNQYDDVISKINTDLDVSCEYRIDYQNDNQAKNEEFIKKTGTYTNVDFDRNSEVRKQAEIYELRKISLSDKFIYCTGSYALKSAYSYLYNKTNGSTIDLSALHMDVIGTDLYFITADSEYFYVPVPVIILKKSILENPEDYSQEIIEAVKDVDDNANPIIIKIKILEPMKS